MLVTIHVEGVHACGVLLNALRERDGRVFDDSFSFFAFVDRMGASRTHAPSRFMQRRHVLTSLIVFG